MSNELRTKLISLCDFSQLEKWKLLYRASKDGFNGGAFHSRCNSIKKTITIIKTTNSCVFGGYTDEAWTAAKQYIWDNNAFIFSLVNEGNQPTKIKCSNPEYAIYSRPDRGPVFGNGHTKQGFDLCIKNSSNLCYSALKSKSSYSNLGVSYIHPSYPEGAYSVGSRTFLAGTRRFETLEIEVYCKL